MNIVKTEHESILKLNELYVERIEFSFNPNSESNKLTFDLSDEIDERNKDGEYSVRLKGIVKNEDKSLFLSVDICAVFQCENDNDLSQNALAIMFPYLRTQISSITCQPGIMPIIIPPININAYIESKVQEK